MGKSKIFPILHENLTKIIWLIQFFFVPLHQQLKQRKIIWVKFIYVIKLLVMALAI